MAVGQNAAQADGDSSGPATNGPSPATSPPNVSANQVQSTGTAPNASGPVTAKTANPGAPDPRVLDDVLAELAELGPVQPDAQKRLIDDLRKTDPAYWPMLVQTFRASVAYRRRGAQNATVGQSMQSPAVADSAHADVLPVAAGEAINEAAPAPVVRTGMAASPKAVPVTSTVAATSTNQSTAIPQQPATTGPPSSDATKVPGSIEWRRHLDAAIAELESQTRGPANDPESLANQVYLRLLDLAAGRRDNALKPIAGLPAVQQDFWANQLFALSTYLDRSPGDPAHRAAEANVRLSRAAAMLSEQGTLLVRNLAFCTDVHSYGVIKRFEPAEFHAEQQILLYAEIENFKSDETAQGFHTSLEASYEILDRQGNRVTHDDLPRTEEHCQNRRRDFFVHYFLRLPKTINEGNHTLKLTIEDKLARKIGQSTIDFIVKQK
jgi:hypothetical protein